MIVWRAWKRWRRMSPAQRSNIKLIVIVGLFLLGVVIADHLELRNHP